ncbi:Peroxidase 27 [Linum grandiflorum]
MAASKGLLALLLLQICFSFTSANTQLKVGYYSQTCPNAEVIVKKVMDQVMSVAPSLSGPLLRMQFHDCFIRYLWQGCDASVLIDSTKYNQAEKDAIPNLSLRGFGVIDRVKAALEMECPGIVSCSDILAIVARDVTVATKGLRWEVETGRKDGRTSIMNEALFGLIPPSANISFLISGFKAVGLSIKDLVVLQGSHTIGISHCSSFTNRIYNFTGNGGVDPTMDSEYIPKLRRKCKTASDQTTVVEMDPGSFKTFDNGYFKQVAKRRALFQSDAAMLDNAETKAYVEKSLTVGSTFLKDFGDSMVKMGRIGVLTGDAGEIRKVCYKINDQ